MPLPLIIGGIAAVAGAIGAGTAINGAVKMKDANDTAKSSEERNKRNNERMIEKEKECSSVMDELGKTELDILSSFDKFSEIFEKIKNKPVFQEINIGNIQLPKYEESAIKEVAVGAGVLIGGLGGAAMGTAGGFAAAGATTAAVMALGTASTGTAIASLSGAAATNATLAALGGGAIAAGGGGMALGAAVLGGATLGIGLLVGGIIFNVTGSKLSEKAAEAEQKMKKEEKKINGIVSYLDRLQTLAEVYTNSIKKVNTVYRKHLDYLDFLVNIGGKDNWLDYNESERIAVQNTVLLVQLLYGMCKVKLVIQNEDENELNTINTAEVRKQLVDVKAICSSKDFEYSENLRDVVVSLKKADMFCFDDESALVDLLYINIDEARVIKDLINRKKKVIILCGVTAERANALIEKMTSFDNTDRTVKQINSLQALDVKSVVSGSSESAVYYKDYC